MLERAALLRDAGGERDAVGAGGLGNKNTTAAAGFDGAASG